MLTLLLALALPEPFDAKVVGISDGDTLTVLDARKVQHKIRLHGIDAPEKGQAFGNKSKDTAAAMVAGAWVRVVPVDTDRYGRTVAVVWLGKRNVNQALVESGMAWRFVKYDKKGEFTKSEAEARSAKRGLWADKEPVSPWEYRRIEAEQRKAKAAAKKKAA